VLALQDGLVGHPGADLHDAGRLDHDFHRRRPDDIHGILGHSGTTRATVCALDRILAPSLKRAQRAFEVEIGGGHHLHTWYTPDLRYEASAHLAYADEADANGGTPPLKAL
jgi:hypothetical protein